MCCLRIREIYTKKIDDFEFVLIKNSLIPLGRDKINEKYNEFLNNYEPSFEKIVYKQECILKVTFGDIVIKLEECDGSIAKELNFTRMETEGIIYE